MSREKSTDIIIQLFIAISLLALSVIAISLFGKFSYLIDSFFIKVILLLMILILCILVIASVMWIMKMGHENSELGDETISELRTTIINQQNQIEALEEELEEYKEEGGDDEVLF